jgi:hypothetical protein
MSLRRQTTPERFESERFFDFKNKKGAPLNDYLEPWLALMLYGYVNYFDDAWQELKDVCDDESEHNKWLNKARDFTTRVYIRTGANEASKKLSLALRNWKLNDWGVLCRK